MRRYLAVTAVVAVALGIIVVGCGKRKSPADGPTAPGATAQAPGTPGAPAPGGAPGTQAPGGAPGGQSAADRKTAFEKAKSDFPGTFAVMRAVSSLRTIEGDKKGATLSKKQAQGILPILKNLQTKATLSQADAKKAADDISGFLTPDQQGQADAARKARMSGGKGGPGGAPGGGTGGPGGGMGKGGPGDGGGGKGGAGGGGPRMDWSTMTADKNPFLEGRMKDQLTQIITGLEAKAK